MSQSRDKKLRMLTQSIARGDFGRARELLGASGKRQADKEDARSDGKPVGLEAAGGPIELAAACPGVESSIITAAGELRHWLIRRTLAEISPDSLPVARRYAAVMRGAGQRLDELEASAALCHAAGARPEDLLFMDIETCGLAGTAIFLVGTMSFAEGQLIFEQHLARDYSEEPAILRAFLSRLEGAGVLVTFNGKAFDMTQVRERAAFHAIEVWSGPRGEGPPHLDLLQESRRRWKKSLPNCKLQTLERHLCGRLRTGDIPGWAIPDAYHRFVSTRDARQIRDIVHHNMLDLLTMAELLCATLTGSDAAGE
ncbi:MAG: ribonuclease H-like domain-containing protein [Phycisphaerae bacterium]